MGGAHLDVCIMNIGVRAWTSRTVDTTAALGHALCHHRAALIRYLR